MKILIACEYSGIVRDAFKEKGHDVMSCDLLATQSPGKHYQGDVFDIINDGWDMMIGFPPCTFLTVTANKYFINNPERWQKRLDAINFFYELWKAPIERIAMENPKGILRQYIGKASQIVHPYYFGDTTPKETHLWLKNLPQLKYDLQSTLFNEQTAGDPEYIIYNSKKTKSGKSKYATFARLGSGSGKERSVFYQQFAKAMADQWSIDITENEEDKGKLKMII